VRLYLFTRATEFGLLAKTTSAGEASAKVYVSRGDNPTVKGQDVATLNGIEQTDSPKSIANLAKKE
jgi:hypothetical protein